jgi:23S rRNA pseudouridine1911/1915/1917 synthase
MPEINKIKIKVPGEFAGQRLDKYLSHVPEIRTRSRASKLIDLGNVKKMGSELGRGSNNEASTLKSSYKVMAGDLIEVEIPPESDSLHPLIMNLDVYYEDDDLLVINKPS